MKRIFTHLLLALVALSAGAVTNYAVCIGNYILSSSDATSAATLTSSLKSSGVLKSGTVALSVSDTKLTLTLTDAVLENSNTDGVIFLGARNTAKSQQDFSEFEINVNGTCSVTNTRSGGSAMCAGGAVTTGATTVNFTGSGTLNLVGGSNNGAGFMASHRSKVVFQMSGQRMTINSSGPYAFRSIDNTSFEYRLQAGTLNAKGSVLAMNHYTSISWKLSGGRVLSDPVGGSFYNSNGFYTMCDKNGNMVSSFTVTGKTFPVYVCGEQITVDNMETLTDVLTAKGYLKSGTVKGIPYANSVELNTVSFDCAVIQYNGMSIIQNGDHNIVEGTKTAGLDNLTLDFMGNNTLTSTQNRYGIDNNHANITLNLYMGAQLTINAGDCICHNLAMSADANPSGNYRFLITGSDYKYGETDNPARLTLNATTGYGISGGYGNVVHNYGAVTIKSAKGAFSVSDNNGEATFQFKRYDDETKYYGFLHGESVYKTGNFYVFHDVDGNVANDAEIGWVGRTYGIKFKGVPVTDYHLQKPQVIFGTDDIGDNHIKYTPDNLTLSIESEGKGTYEISCTNENIPLIESDIDGLIIKSVGYNTLYYNGTVLKLNQPATFNTALTADSLYLRSYNHEGILLTGDGVLNVESGALIAMGKTYGVSGTYARRINGYYGDVNMTGGYLRAWGTTASIGRLYAFNLVKGEFFRPTGAQWSSTQHGVVDASGNLVGNWHPGSDVKVGVLTAQLYVAGTQVTSLNCNDILGDGTAQYDFAAHRLTLNNANITAVPNDRGAIRNEGENNLRIRANGNCRLTNENGYGLLLNAGSTIDGSGRLKITGTTGGIYIKDDLDVIGGVYVEAEGHHGIYGRYTKFKSSITTYADLRVRDSKTVLRVRSNDDNGYPIFRMDYVGLFDGIAITQPEGATFETNYFVRNAAGEYIYNSNEWVQFSDPSQATVTGDVNKDGSVNVGDVTAIYNIILGGSTDFTDSADVNNDGSITVGDVTAVYNIILGTN